MKKRVSWVVILALAGYLASGFYVVKGNQKAVVRRCGWVLVIDSGEVELRGSGLHYDLPWPFAVVDRVNLNEIHTLVIGAAESDAASESGFLRSLAPSHASQFLTGDKNILNLQISVQYRISQTGVREFLFASESPARQLKLLVESVAADLVSRSGVDFVHPLGLGELREEMTARTKALLEEEHLGIEVEDVAINAVYPPVRVKADFLDVQNARSDREKYVNSARAYAVQRLEAGRAEARRIVDAAETYRDQTIQSANGSANSFNRLVAQLRSEEQQGIHSYAEARQMALHRMYTETMSDILSKVAGKVLLDSGEEVDLTIFRDPKE